MIPIDLSGKVALITGGSRGIGKAISAQLHRAGAAVSIVGRDAGRADAVAEALGERAIASAADVTKVDELARVVETTEAKLGSIDILVNNAGITRDNLVLRLSESDWNDVLQTNLTSAFLATKLVIKGMMKRRYGRIINITSVVGLTGNKGQANYAASKAGMIGFTKSVAQEYAGRGILVNCIAPGFIKTDMTAALSDEAAQALLERIPLGRLGDPQDVAGAVIYLASELGSYVTGQVMVVDGGMVS